MGRCSLSTNATLLHQDPVAFRLSLISKGHVIANATASIWQQKNKRFLVSNWHVFSGRNTYTGQPLHKSGATPEWAELHYMRPWPYCQSDVKTSSFKLPLISENDEPIWLQHKCGQEFDLACVEISIDCPISEASILPHKHDDRWIPQLPGTDVYIMGFPNKLDKQGGYPIWKRASVASHPHIVADDLPVTLVDTSGREGMSGAPAFVVQYGASLVAKEGRLATQLGFPFYRFAGIYSGRYGANGPPEDEFDAQLGRLWWEHIIQQMLDDPVPGSWHLQNC